MEPTTYQEKCAMAIDVGRSEFTNPKRREFPWYGMWNLILNKHFSSTSAFLVSPQYPLWHLDNVDGESGMDSHEKVSQAIALKHRDAIVGGIKRVIQSLTQQPATQQSSAEESFASLTLKPSDPIVGGMKPINQSSTHHPSTQQSLADESFDIIALKASDPMVGGKKPVNQSSTQQSLAEESFDSVASRHGDKCCVPDFAVIYLSSPKGPHSNWELGGKPRVPLIMEVKKWFKCGDRQKDKEMLRKTFSVAEEDLEKQARYLFTDSSQKSVLAVAACEDRWTWAKLTTRNNPPPETTAERDDPDWKRKGDKGPSPTWTKPLQWNASLEACNAFQKLMDNTKDKSLWDKF